MILSPKGNGSNLCYGLEEYNANRSAPSQVYTAVNAFILILFLFIVVCVLCIFFKYQAHPLIRFRSLMLTLFTTAGYVILFIGVPVRLLVSADFPCILFAFTWILGATLQAGSSCLRLISLLNTGRFHRNAGKVGSIFGPRKGSTSAVDDASSTTTSSSSKSTRNIFAFINVHSSFVALLLSALEGESSDPRHYFLPPSTVSASSPFPNTKKTLQQKNRSQGSTTSPPLPQATLSALQANQQATAATNLQLNLYSLKSSSMLKVFSVFLIPGVIIFIPLMATQDVYKGNCYGCDLFWEMLICFWVSYLGLLAVRLRVAVIIEREDIPDPYFLIPETRTNALMFVIGVIISSALVIIDPGSLDYNQQVSWLWPALLVVILVYLNENTRTCYVVLRDAWLQRQFYRLQEQGMDGESSGAQQQQKQRIIDILVALEDDDLAQKFEAFSEKNFVVESSMFLRDARAFKKWMHLKPEATKLKAAKLVDRYIKQSSPLEINISSECRELIEGDIASGNITTALFQPAEKEVAEMVKFQYWDKFLKSIEESSKQQQSMALVPDAES